MSYTPTNYCLYTATGDIVCSNKKHSTIEHFTAFNVVGDQGILSSDGVIVMSPGDILRTPNGNFTLEYAMDGNLLVKDRQGREWYRALQTPTSLFPKQAVLQGDGNFVLYGSRTREERDDVAYWATNTAYAVQQGLTPTRLVITDGGQLRLLDRNGNELWSPVLSPFSAAGGTVTSVDRDRIHTFTSSGTFTVSGEARNMQVLIVGGGGGGGGFAGIGGGGGGGQVVHYPSVRFDIGTYNIVVGSGGAQNQNGGLTHVRRNNTDWLWAQGGGAGAQVWKAGNDGASGGGGSSVFSGMVGGKPTAFGTSGGDGFFNNLVRSGPTSHNAGGGGGAGGAAENIVNMPLFRGGNGGAGLVNAISGTQQYYGAGGGGGATIASWVGNTTPSSGGIGGGGNGGFNNWYTRGNPTNGQANTGSGGGGSAWDGIGGAGGSGIVIIRYTMPS
jgi:hypothetical protein